MVSSKLPKSPEDPDGLMAEIDAGAGKEGEDTPTKPEDHILESERRETTPVAVAPTEPAMGDSVEEPPENPPAYTPPSTERWGKLMSRVNYPAEVKHQEGAIRLSPRSILKVDGNLIAHDAEGRMILPKGAQFVPDRR